ncbi:MAG: EAL domain-containing response regulator [gamma proteobacterium symbiont of Taylorina sp.]|nr:EAL domain-containing response regulator [gamma proteobacterium symbiont of Taylorina sp.]
MTNKPQLVVIDDEAGITEFVCDVAEGCGYSVQSHLSFLDFERHFISAVDVIVLDLVLPDMDGVEVLRYLAEKQVGAAIILVSGYDDSVLHSAKNLAKERGLNIKGSMSKPIKIDDLETLLLSIKADEIKKKQQSKIASTSITEAELEQGIKQKEFVLYYQPKIELNNNQFSSTEALVRWKHPEKGLLPPDAFIPLAEESGLMDQLSQLILETSFKQCEQCGLEGLHPFVSVNLSANNIKSLEFPEWLLSNLLKYSLSSSDITIELTETAIMADLVNSLEILTRIRMKGFNLSIDDFGTGYSSLQQLYRIPFTEMKIDRSFVMDALQDKEARAIIEMSIILGHKLGMKIVAEGVETKESLELIRELGCDFAQGYFIARPMPYDNLLEWIPQWQEEHPL